MDDYISACCNGFIGSWMDLIPDLDLNNPDVVTTIAQRRVAHEEQQQNLAGTHTALSNTILQHTQSLPHKQLYTKLFHTQPTIVTCAILPNTVLSDTHARNIVTHNSSLHTHTHHPFTHNNIVTHTHTHVTLPHTHTHAHTVVAHSSFTCAHKAF